MGGFNNTDTFSFLYFLIIFIGVQLIYNVVLVSGVQQSESVVIYMYPLFFRFFSHIGHYGVSNRDLFSYGPRDWKSKIKVWRVVF